VSQLVERCLNAPEARRNNVEPGEVLDLTGCGLDIAAVATDLLFVGRAKRSLLQRFT
jgi:hypothetical protein